MSECTILDLKQLDISTGGDDELAEQVVEVFLSDLPDQLDGLAQAVRANEVKTAERIAHSIKGAAATVGGIALRDTASECEQLGHAGDLTTMASLLPALRDQFAELGEALRKEVLGEA